LEWIIALKILFFTLDKDVVFVFVFVVVVVVVVVIVVSGGGGGGVDVGVVWLIGVMTIIMMEGCHYDCQSYLFLK
jgi:hypothetical protein